MLQHEFETLYGKKVGENEFEIINALYMLNDNETKQEFVTRYKKMSKDDLMSAFIALNQRSKEYNHKLNARVKELENVMYEIAEDAQLSHEEVIRQRIRKTLGHFNVINHLWKKDIPLQNDDVDTLMFMAENGKDR